MAAAEFEAEAMTTLQGWHSQDPRGTKGCLRGWWRGGADVTGDDFWRNPHFLVTEVNPPPPPSHPPSSLSPSASLKIDRHSGRHTATAAATQPKTNAIRLEPTEFILKVLAEAENLTMHCYCHPGEAY